MVLNGLVRPSLWHTVLAVAGAALLHRGVTGNCALYSEFGIDTARQDHQRAESRREQHRTYGYGKRGQHSLRDEVNRDSEDSFPASDPPSFTPTAALGSPGGRK